MNISVFCTTVGSSKARKLSGIEKLDYCASAESVSSIKNPFVRNILQDQRAHGQINFKKCPLLGVASILDSSESRRFVSNIMPLGKYSIKMKLYDEKPKLQQLRLDLAVSFKMVAD